MNIHPVHSYLLVTLLRRFNKKYKTQTSISGLGSLSLPLMVVGEQIARG